LEPARKKRVRRSPETTRALILEAAERIMVEEGYAAVSTRRVAQELSINGATVHYYYPTTDDLFLALHARMMGLQVEALGNVLSADNPLEALWEFQTKWDRSALGIEFMALSNHRKSLRPVLAALANRARAEQANALASALTASPLDPAVLPPIALATMLVAVARTLANEERIGITSGHDEVRSFISWALRAVNPAQPKT
jgi:AcrR family transcriptional regulator